MVKNPVNECALTLHSIGPNIPCMPDIPNLCGQKCEIIDARDKRDVEISRLQERIGVVEEQVDRILTNVELALKYINAGSTVVGTNILRIILGKEPVDTKEHLDFEERMKK